MIPYTKAVSMPLNFINLILWIVLFIIGEIKSEDSFCNDNPAPSCKKTLLYPDFYCRLSDSNTNKYFYVERSGDEKVCKYVSSCPSSNINDNYNYDKVVAETKECVLNCAHFYEIGDFCFDPSSLEDLSKYNRVPFTNKYICKDYTYIKLIDGKAYHICIDDPSKNNEDGVTPLEVSNKCPSLYYDVDEKICKESCGNKKIAKLKGKDNNDNFDYYECREECEIGKYEYHEEINGISSNNIYCIDECPPNAPYYYDISGISSKCLKKCNSKHFYDNKKKCSPICEGYYIIDTSKDFFECTDNCPSGYFSYQKACLKSCKDTQLNIAFSKKTYEFSLESTKVCVDDCFSYNNYLSDDETLSCVPGCFFHYNHKCIKSCSMLNGNGKKFYYIHNFPPFSEDISNMECVTECPDDYFLYSETICIKSCGSLSSECPFASLKEKKCVACKKGEGFILNSEFERLENPDHPNNIFCYESCPCGTYYEINDNICYDKSIKDNTCYFPEDNDAICYHSCKDIPGGYIYENNHICYREFNCGDKYYYKIGEITKCIENDVTNRYIQECSSLNLNYLEGKQCVSSCDSSKYRIEPEKNIYTGVINLGKCCSSIDCDINYKYYSEDDKILKKTCSLKIIDNEESPKISKKGTCVLSCPEDFPYEEDNICKSVCTKFYYLGEDKKICASNCESINKFYFDGEKECINNCSKLIEGKLKYFYYSGYKCYTSCHLINKFSLDTTINYFPQKCLDSCPDNYKYYYETDNICLSNCDGGFYEGDGSNKCVFQCKSSEFVKDDNVCTSQCPPEEPFSAYIKLNDIFINKCVGNCKAHNYDFFYNNKCMMTCPDEAPYHYQNSMECLEKCPEGYFSDSNICLTKCSDTPYFILDAEKKFYKCVQNCDLSLYYVSITGECVNHCNIGENFIGKNKRCKNYCDENEDGIYFKKYAIEKTIDEKEYNIYLCVNTYGSNEYLVDGTKEVTDNCPTNKPYLSPNGNICYKDCKNDALYPFSIEEDGQKKCSFECKSEVNKYFDKEEKICLPNCDIYSNNIINEEDNSCVSKCNLNSNFKFQTQKEENGKVYCSQKCELENYKKYSENDYICKDTCTPPYNFVDGDLCLDKCPENKFVKTISETEYNCVDICEEGEYYYKNERKCVNCENGYVIQNTNICTSNCSSVSSEIDYHFYEYESPSDTTSSTQYTKNTCVIKCPDDKPFLREDNHCYTTCNDTTFKYYIEEEKKCLEKCPAPMVIDDKKCKASCPKETFLDTKTNKCISNCKYSKYKEFYYIPGENVCLEKCSGSLYKDGHKCVSSCPDNKYLDTLTNKCVEKCIDGMNYIITEFTHGEIDTQKKCLKNCTEIYPYYIESGKIKKCISSCDYYVLPNRQYPIPIKCYTDNCPDGYKYFIKYENGTTQCLTSCPNDMKFYDSSKRCYKKCPKEEPYFEFSSDKCLSECSNKIDYETKECVLDCSYNQKWAKDENGKIYCLNECNIQLGMYLLGKECVKSCDSEKFLIIDITDPSNMKCNCKNLFYLDNSGNKICFDPRTKECGETGSDAADYKYRIYNGSYPTNECTKQCLGYLSPSEDICYINIECENIDIKNTTLIISDNKLKCDCKYRYYIDSTNRKKICLEDECSVQEYRFYIPDEKQCVRNCKEHDKKMFDNYCFSACSSVQNSNIIGEKCICSNYFYRNGDNYKCCESCPLEYPYLIEERKECVKKCEGTDYEIYYKDKCYSSCSAITGMYLSKIASVDERIKKIAPYTCQCDNIWYYDNYGQIECTTSTEVQECLEHNFRYLIKDTKQCINSCPLDYSFTFNNECFKTCEDANHKYQYPIKEKPGSKECICNNLWKVTENRIVCLNDVVCEKMMVEETKECLDNCPPDYPLKFNSKCYKACPSGTKENITTGTDCICNNLWYRQTNGDIFCLTGNECVPSHPYKNSINNECQQLTCEKYILNYTCYERCPKGTKPNDDLKICECDPDYGYWYREGNYYPRMFCELDNCPIDRRYPIKDKKECLKSCGENGLYEYDFICYEGGCPQPTVSENSKTNKYKCRTKKFIKASTLSESYHFLKEEIVELCPALPDTGIIYKNFSSTIQIYGISKEDSKLKDRVFRSSLSYIDISSCSKKVFENNQMKEDDKIIVIKYDLESQKNKSLVNPVEYEFVNSRTGQLLDMTVCTKNDVVVSYSLSNILNYIKKAERALEESPNDESIIYQIQEQYEKGKIITSIYNIDSFNINSTLYRDLCFSIELNGKDLVLEDRVKYLYPYYSLCEENCTYSHTDFDIERIYCNCPLKTEFNLQREHKYAINSYNKDEIIPEQKGPTNIPVMTCMSRLKEKKSITENGGFFYSLIILIIELALFLITIFYNYNLFIEKVAKINDKDEEIKKIVYIEENTIKHKKNIKNTNNSNEVNIKTSQRDFNSPPKRKEAIVNNQMDIKLKKKIEDQKDDNDGTQTEDQKNSLNQSMNESFDREYLLSIMKSIKNEQKLLRVKFDIAFNLGESDIFITLLTEIFDKIYFIKSIFLLSKYDMFSIYFSVYFLYHLLLLTFTTCFYDIKTIQNIWIKENYPNLQYHLGYGLLSCLIVWVIYKIFLCIINNEDNVKKYLKAKINRENKGEDYLQKKYDDFKCKVKTRMIIYFVLVFIIGVICLLYITTFCAVYTGTKKYVFKTYGITLVEVLIIKIVYGIVLGILRKVALNRQSRVMYKIVYCFDRFIH